MTRPDGLPRERGGCHGTPGALWRAMTEGLTEDEKEEVMAKVRKERIGPKEAKKAVVAKRPAPERELQWVPVADIVLSGYRAQRQRRARYDREALDELIASVREHGVLQPLFLRDLGPAGVELVAGERRLEAAKAAGLKAVPCVVSEMSDVDAMQAQLVENLQRQGLDPLTEAEGLAGLSDAGLSAADIARRLGRSRSHVLARLKLKRLCAEGREALMTGELDAATAVLVARIPRREDQVAATKRLTRLDWSGARPTHREAKRIVAHEWMRSVESTPWDRGAEMSAPGAGWPGDRAPSCEKCPRRTGNDRDAYPDSDPQLCTSVECWDAKAAALVAAEEAALRADGEQVADSADVYDERGIVAGGWVLLRTSVTQVRGVRKLAEFVSAGQVWNAVCIRHGGVVVDEVTSLAVARAVVKDGGGGDFYHQGEGNQSVPGPQNRGERDERSDARREAAAAKRRALHAAYRRELLACADADLSTTKLMGRDCVVLPEELARRLAAHLTPSFDDQQRRWWEQQGGALAKLPAEVAAHLLPVLIEDGVAGHEGVTEEWATAKDAKALEARCAAAGIDVKRVKREAGKANGR